MHTPPNVRKIITFAERDVFRCPGCDKEFFWRRAARVDAEGRAYCGACARDHFAKGEPRLRWCRGCGKPRPEADFRLESRETILGPTADEATRCAECRARAEGPTVCEHCGGSLLAEPTALDRGLYRDGPPPPRKAGRRDRRYCSTRCRVAAHRARTATV